MAKSGAERQREYKARKQKDGTFKSEGGANSKWEAGYFVALDGEGINRGEHQSFSIEGGKTYYAQDHLYTLLAASTGESLYNGGERLDSMECIEWLLGLSDSHKQGIFVIFAGSYDINHMLFHGFEREQLHAISQGRWAIDSEEKGAFRFEHAGAKYEIEYRARKSLTIRKGLYFVCDKKGNFKSKWRHRIVVWDVFGFFQENFVAVMGKWLGVRYKHYELIKSMKALRGDFANVPQSDINAYNAAELETLARIMEKVRSALKGLDITISRWDGAGAVAAGMMRKHNIRAFKQETPPHMLKHVATAYAGGRIEVCKIGHCTAPVYDYDINSAYPTVMADMPDMAKGAWIHGTGTPPPGFTLVRCEFDFVRGLPFYPLFFRTEKMQISFPRSGAGIYWYPEYEAALAVQGILTVIEWWKFEPATDVKPFHWIPEYYKTRQQWVKNPLEEWQGGGEKIIKLGLNSLYGKTAQQLGGSVSRSPAYHQLEWAGYITAATRARLFNAGMLDSDAIIAFATDGIFSKRRLRLDTSAAKQIGTWDLQIFQGLTIAMAGVYWLHENADYKHFSRGFDKDSMKSPALLLDAWKKGLSEIDIKMRKLITMGSACVSDVFWEMRGRFTESERTLHIDGFSHKRRAIDVKKSKPHLKLVDLIPNENLAYPEHQLSSHPYPIEWMRDEDFENALEDEREMEDTVNI